MKKLLLIAAAVLAGASGLRAEEYTMSTEKSR